MSNVIVWFEIPVTNIERATNFYAEVLDVDLFTFEKDDVKMAMFPHSQDNVSGGLVESARFTPSDKGTMVYFNGGDDLALPLSRVEAAGGKVLQGKMSIGEHGFIAICQDTEGNRIGLHSMR